MTVFIKAFIQTILMTEIAAVAAFTTTWIVLADFHAGLNTIIGGEVVTAFGIAALAIAVFRRALQAERRMVEARIRTAGE